MCALKIRARAIGGVTIIVYVLRPRRWWADFKICCAGAGDDIVRGARKVARGDAPIICTGAGSVTVAKNYV
eukprot:1946659-Pleurochrysis_carterae.AAC.1